ncbi:RnfH family protein [Lysobacteraceae bacterium NML75-0749]|nr:RnfH family protein [Xanthomonadaceae bacterium NML75-0749]PJK03455.1 RnfH family protein [Xanthomonadaceae bacterium NML91-0268]
MKIEILAVWSEHVQSQTLALADGATVADALAASTLARDFPLAGMAIFGKRVTETTVLHEGDRLELLRALLADPKQSRRKRAEAAQAEKTAKNKARG